MNQNNQDFEALQLQIESLKLANAALQKQLLEEAEHADAMLREVERQRNELSAANRLQQDLANRSQRVIDAVSSLVYRLDPYGRIVQANQQGLQFLGLAALDAATPFYLDDWLSADDIRLLKEQTPPRPWQIYSCLLERIRLEGNYTGHHSLRNSLGQYRQFMLDATMIYDRQGKEDGTVVCAADITELKRLEQDLRQANSKAESAARSKSEFLANMSHEIRTPMNAIVGLSQLAMNRDVSPQIRDYLEKIKGSSDHLLSIINDILDFSKIEAGGMTIEAHPFGIARLVADIEGLFRFPAEQKGLELQLRIGNDVPAMVVGDKLRIQQILTNLISNALKFTTQGRVRLTIELVSREEQRVNLAFAIADQGIGIAPADQEKLFQPFSQADSSISRRFGGTGLGLAISRKLLLMMGSDFHVASAVNQGSTFTFTLSLGLATEQETQLCQEQPIHSSAGSLTDRMQTYAAVLTGMEVLIAEDNPLNRQVVREFLQLAGIKTTFATNGREALECLALNPGFAAILMDVNMPEMGGIEATQLIRQQPAHARLPIIALTAGVTYEEKEHCLASGMTDFVSKPIEPVHLLNTLLNWTKPELSRTDADAIGMLTATQRPRLKLPGFDLSNLNLMLGGNEEDMFELLQGFACSLATVEARLNAYFAADDSAAIMALAHEIKGSAGNFGAKALFGAASILERAAKQRQVTRALLDECCHQCREAASVLQTADKTTATDAASPSVSGQIAQAAQALAGKRILVVEDNRINQRVVAEFLQLAGMEVDAVNNGLEALAQIDAVFYDAILMDIQMPELDGISTTQAIRNKDSHRSLPVIALSASISVAEHKACLESGFNDFLTKPVDPEGLIAKLNQWLLPTAAQATLVNPPPDAEPENAADPLWPTIAGIDTKQAALLLGGSLSLFAELAALFVSENSSLMAKLTDHLAHNRFDEAAKFAHKLRGQAASLAAIELAESAELLENALAKRSDHILGSQHELLAANRRLIAAIRDWLEE
ncbi:response regulator [Methylomonas sp. HW2-6]|uniref:response regulator n=1 Tax=Methylomonas sp. HW2-6 TaxID=3376687 RepID=UPI0040427712